MKLKEKYKGSNMYYCEVTEALDRLANLKTDSSLWRHYLLLDSLCIKDGHIAIRIPGGTVGDLRVDKSGKILDITIDTRYVVRTYDSTVNEKIREMFIGSSIENLNLNK